MKTNIAIVCFFLLLVLACKQNVEVEITTESWHQQDRVMRYRTEGNDFVITNGTLRFNRALYGTNTGFRVEAGDLPEFALYMPRMGGTLRLGLMQGDSSKWLIDAQTIEARYQAGTMFYTISDPLLGKGKLQIQVLALAEADGMIIKTNAEKIPKNVELFWAFGGATGKRFSRDGDLGADPESSFYLKAENCAGNEFIIDENRFDLYYGEKRDLVDNEIVKNNSNQSNEDLENIRLSKKNHLFGYFPKESVIQLGDASQQISPFDFYKSEANLSPVLMGKLKLSNEFYFLIANPESYRVPESEKLDELFNRADQKRLEIAGRVKIETPDPYVNAAGSVLSTAADAVWDGKSFMHGAIAWRMPLNGWRGAYAADWLGWHDRAKTHFRGYFEAQYTEPASMPSEADPKTNLARHKEEAGTSLFSEGYISRNPGKINKPHHYDMNLVFIDQLLSHFRWTGDLDFLRESWPVLERHLAWEKRNFDANDDGLYDSYCSIWASDALQYSGGGVSHSSAYNYRANLMAAQLAQLIGKDPEAYKKEAEKIKNAVNRDLWLKNKGWYAEYKDLLGNQLVHPSAALWTIYHSIDEGLCDPFQSYQSTQYVDRYIPHIPVHGEGIPDGTYYTLSTTNWMPYTWSINNVALAEVLHTSLAYWQANRSDEAFTLMKSSFLDYMFMGSSPGNFGQLSFYDAFRGELYRDFADPIAMASRAMIEGLFGVKPDILNRTLTIQPGFPNEWKNASLETPDLTFNFKKKGNKCKYYIDTRFPVELKVKLLLNTNLDKIKLVKVNGKKARWSLNESAIGFPQIEIETNTGVEFEIEIDFGGEPIEKPVLNQVYALGDVFSVQLENNQILEVYDPQRIFNSLQVEKSKMEAELEGDLGRRTAFIKLKQGEMTWWQPLSFDLRKPFEIIYSEKQPVDQLHFYIQNNTFDIVEGLIKAGGFNENVGIGSHSRSFLISIPANELEPGSNYIEFQSSKHLFSEKIVKWDNNCDNEVEFETLNLSGLFNDKVTNIFSEQYFSPRSPYPTLSIPVQGIGDWCSYRETVDIDDSGLRKLAGDDNRIYSPHGIPFSTPGTKVANIVFTSQWDNYPNLVTVDLKGKAKHLYLLMAGSAHHMQINMENAIVKVTYSDGTEDTLPLISPDNWWPIEQDYYIDGYAFQVKGQQAPRLYLKTGEWHFDSYDVLAKNKTNKIEGGAASLLDLPLNAAKELKSLSLETQTNDVVIGIMAATLVR